MCLKTRHAALAPSSCLFQKRGDSLLVVLGCKTVEYVDPGISTLFLVIGWDGDAGATL